MAGYWGRESGFSTADALRVVGVRRQEVERLAGSIFADRPAFLVGSLAAGLGNEGSDIDVHVFTEGDAPVGLMELFAGERPVEVQQFDLGIPRGLMAGFRANAAVRQLKIGPCAVGGEAPARATQRRMAHWLYALPFSADQMPARVFAEDDESWVHAVLVRGAVEETLLCAATAILAEETGASATAYTWRRTGRWLLETVVRAAGDLFVAEKWLPRRIARAGVAASLAGDLYGLTDGAGFRKVLGRLGVEGLDPKDVVVLRRPDDAEPVKIGPARFILLTKTRLVQDTGVPAGPLGDALADVGPEAVLRAVGSQELIPRVDPSRLDAVLSDQL
ncbi:nucleotidyltransferase domain-containing protein [Plantactinospora sp. B6F1]|uniref:nucleotidyltransferase domain-containing protein n=1 Tax=Plantactinospora sp. B6F1 TaxID=3158971 RepID=UPI0032D8F369